MERERVQALIILSRNIEEADLEIVKFLGNVSVKEKIAFLRGMFDVQIISRCGQTNDDESDYYSILKLIIIIILKINDDLCLADKL